MSRTVRDRGVTQNQVSRGTDVRDDDTVSVNANFETIEDARDGSEELTRLVIDRMTELRTFDPEEPENDE